MRRKLRTYMESQKHADHRTPSPRAGQTQWAGRNMSAQVLHGQQEMKSGPQEAFGGHLSKTKVGTEDRPGRASDWETHLRHSLHQPALLGGSKPTWWESHVRQSWPGAGTTPHQPCTAMVGDTQEHGGLGTNVQQGPKMLEPEGVSHLLSSQLRATRREELHAWPVGRACGCS